MTARFRGVPLVLFIAVASIAAVTPQTIVVPSGTSIHFELRKTVSTATAKAGESVPAALTAPVVVDGRTVASAGSAAVVHISEAESSGRIGGSAKLTFSLSSITLANGTRVDVRTSSYSREGRAHVKHNATYIGGAAIAGALAGQAIGHDRKTTEKGAAIGAGVGIGAAAATGKFDFEVKTGHRFKLTLKSPIKATL
jgi:hypothetical protein